MQDTQTIIARRRIEALIAGNLRELENAVQQAVLASKGPVLLLQHLPEAVRELALTRLAAARPALVR